MAKGYKLKLHTEVERIAWNNGVGIWHDTQGNESPASCIGCLDKPCMKYSPDELELPDEGFTSDHEHRVCAYDAIELDHAGAFPTIHEEKCVGCGLCLLRCPVAAIQMPSGEPASVNLDSSNDFLTECSDASEIQQTILSLEAVASDSSIYKPEEMERHLNYFHRNMLGHCSCQKCKDQGMIEFHGRLDLLVRNQLLASNCRAALAKTGDTHVRIQGLAKSEFGQYICFALEKGMGPETVRRLLGDDVPFLVSRMGKNKENVQPLVFVPHLPTKRTDALEVANEVFHQYDIPVTIMPIGIFGLINWSRKTLVLPQECLRMKPYHPDSNHLQFVLQLLDVDDINAMPGLLWPTK